MQQEAFLRQLDILDPAEYQDTPVTVIGAGGIGAATVVALAKTGFRKIAAWDPDVIEMHNYPNQLLPLYVGGESTIGWPKVKALFHMIDDMAHIDIEPHEELYVSQDVGQIVIVGVDSLEARRNVWAGLEQSMDIEFLVDGRMAITSMDLYAVNMMEEDEVAYYVTSLEGEDEEQSCTARATMFNSFVIAGEIALLCAAYVNGWPHPKRFYYNLRSWETLPINNVKER
jgi:2-polyprenyl-6-methoxyphenol hydroxylase-like FAD-dependent oxidoreductase